LKKKASGKFLSVVLTSVLIILVITTSGLGSLGILAAQGEVVTFADTNLEATIREAIKKSSGDIYQSDLKGLITLLANKRNISDLDGLEYCVNLNNLQLTDNLISDLKPISNLLNLNSLSLANNQVTDLQSLSGLINLERLYLGKNQVVDLSPLAKLNKLTSLSAPFNQVTDLAPVANLTNLNGLYLYGSPISDLRPISNLMKLTQLSLGNNLITDISPISDLTELELLHLQGNKIRDISPLLKLTRLVVLILDGNEIEDITSLSNLTRLGEPDPSRWWFPEKEGKLICLTLLNNQIIDISPLLENTGLSEGDGIDLRGNPLSEDSRNSHIPQLEKRGVGILYDTGSDTNSPPNRPSNITPLVLGSGVSLTPVLSTSPFSDPNPSDTHAASQWQISTYSGDYTNPVFDGGIDTSNLTSITVPFLKLTYSTKYYWHVRYQDNNGAWSEYSEETSFTTQNPPGYELNVEIDYMVGHRPTESVLEYIRNYYANEGIELTFNVDDEVPFDEEVTDGEFWNYESTYNNSDSWIDVPEFDDQGKAIFTSEDIQKFASRHKWVLYGSSDPSKIPSGYVKVIQATSAGNYIFIADKANDESAAVWWRIIVSFGGRTAEKIETVTLMHELGHTIGILKLYNNVREVYDKDTTSVMTELYNYSGDIPLEWYAGPHYSPEYWELRNMEFYQR
jgi:internalin A